MSAAHLEAITNAVERHNGFVEKLGGNLEGWRFNLPDDRHAILTFGDGHAEGDPEAYDWAVGRYDAEGNEVDMHGGFQFADCMFYVSRWKEGAF